MLSTERFLNCAKEVEYRFYRGFVIEVNDRYATWFNDSVENYALLPEELRVLCEGPKGLEVLIKMTQRFPEFCQLIGVKLS